MWIWCESVCVMYMMRMREGWDDYPIEESWIDSKFENDHKTVIIIAHTYVGGWYERQKDLVALQVDRNP